MRSVLATVFLTLFAATTNAAIIYDVNRTIGEGTVTGFIETDGTLGVLSEINIMDWSLILTAPNLNNGIPDSINFSTGSTVIGGTAVSATATQLLYDFDLPVTETHHILFMGASGNFWCLETRNCSDAENLSEHIGRRLNVGTETLQLELRTGAVAFANTAVIPVPAAVWLFASGLIGMVGLARRKR